jgi:hypothetical protein
MRVRKTYLAKSRLGLTALEIFVALTLLSVGLSISASLLVRHQRLLAADRHYRLAMDELCNQLEQLTALSSTELSAAIGEVKPSRFAVRHLPGVELHGELHPDDMGQRVTLSITWDERPSSAAPLALSAWHFPEDADSP